MAYVVPIRAANFVPSGEKAKCVTTYKEIEAPDISDTQVKLKPVFSRIPTNKLGETRTRVGSVLFPPTAMLPRASV